MKPERWDEIDEILQSALEHSPAEREAYLAKACAGDEQLRREVLTLMASHEQAGSFLALPALQGSGDVFEDEPKLKAGNLIGAYRITRPIGRGGMGEVYLGMHTTQSREVALKILPHHFLDDVQRVQRFRREAQAVLALNHPNVVTVYDIGEAEGVHFISTEFVEGQTLRERLMTTRLTIEEAIDIALQVASALSYAHEKGVIHRDVKPENIMLRPDGYVKVLDFGIAKMTERQVKSATNDPNEAPTRVKASTTPGMVMGTVHYMSPEQARGLKVDERTDNWSLGCVLYEMLTGQQPFEGETPSDVIATILKHDPAPLSSILPDVPAELEHIVSKALDKSKDERYQTAKDFLADLRRFKRHYEREADIERSMPPGERTRTGTKVSTGGQQQPSPTVTGESASSAVTAHTTSSAEYIVSGLKRHRKGVLITLAALVVVAVAGFGLHRFLNRDKVGQAAEANAATHALKMTPLPVNGIVVDGTLSPDGKYLVYKETDERGLEISVWLKHLPSDTTVQIVPPTKDWIYGLIFSADSNYVYYGLQSLDTNLHSFNKVSVIGGAPKKLIDNSLFAYFSPSPDGKRVAIMTGDPDKGVTNVLLANDDGTGERVLATRGGDMEWLAGYAMWSHDGKTIACIAGSYVGGIHVSLLTVSVEDGVQKEINTVKLSGQGNPIAVWLPDGSGLLVSGNEAIAPPSQIWYVSYPDGATRKITNDLNDYEVRSVTADSKTVMAVQKKKSEDVWVTPESSDASQSKQATFTGADELSSSAAWTPDGKIVLLSTAGGKRSLWLSNADGSNRRQLVSSDAADYGAAVSPDGRYVVFTSDRNGGTPHIWRVDLDGSNLKQLTFGGSEDQHARVTPDGKWVIFGSYRDGGKLTVWKMPAEGGELVQLSEKPLNFQEVSPDGKLLACYKIDSQPGKTKILLLPIEGGEPVKVFELPELSGGAISWTHDGHAIIFINSLEGIDNIWAMPLDAGKPVRLTNFKSNAGATGQSGISFYALSRDGKRFAITRSNLITSLVLISDFK